MLDSDVSFHYHTRAFLTLRASSERNYLHHLIRFCEKEKKTTIIQCGVHTCSLSSGPKYAHYAVKEGRNVNIKSEEEEEED